MLNYPKTEEMEIIKDYHFYAAHRNELLNDKCRNIHGHTYFVKVGLNFATPEDKNNVTMLFSDVDKIIEPIIKDLDHGMLINIEDPLLNYLNEYQKETGDSLKLIIFNAPTSVENLCMMLYNKIKIKGLPIIWVEVKETTTSTIKYYGK